MNHEEIEMEVKSLDEEEVFVEIDRRDVPMLVDLLVGEVSKISYVGRVNTIRKGKKNPVIDIGGSRKIDDGKIYLNWGDGVVKINLELVNNDVEEAVSNLFKEIEWEKSGDYQWKENNNNNNSGYVSSGQSSHNPHDLSEGFSGDVEFSDVSDVNATVEGERTEFTPPYTKDEADYVGSSSRNRSAASCEDCVHYIEGGGCHMVQGNIDKEAYCNDLYADVGIFGRERNGSFEVTLALWGERYRERLRNIDLPEIADRVKRTISRKL